MVTFAKKALFTTVGGTSCVVLGFVLVVVASLDSLDNLFSMFSYRSILLISATYWVPLSKSTTFGYFRLSVIVSI